MDWGILYAKQTQFRVVEDRGTLERMKLGPSTFPGGQRVDSPSRYRKWVALSVPEAVMGMPEVPIAPSTTARRLSALSARPLSTGGCRRVCLGFWVLDL